MMHPGFFTSAVTSVKMMHQISIFDLMAEYKEMGAVSVGELAINEWIDSPLLTAIFTAAEKTRSACHTSI